MTYKIYLTESFEQDLDSILDYIINTLSSPIAAKNLYHRVKQQLLSVSQFPDMFPFYGRTKYKNSRFFTVGNYVVFYYTDDNEKTVYVQAMLYGAMDIKQKNPRES